MSVPIPLAGYSFRVDFGIPGFFTKDIGFKSVSGINFELKLKDVKVGGVDGGTVQVPDGYKSGDLVLERGMIEGSYLINWLEAQILSQKKIPIPIIVTLLDGKGLPSYCWFFINAYPVKWETSGFDAERSGVLIEKITFKYFFYKQVNMTMLSSAYAAVMGV
ncbi:MAG: conserved hypothetical phage tail region protein [Bacteroidetes bacterium]|nr:MAG: conserved hypothetical phage tail region protein [Bacteroidota bacterium]